MAVRIGIIGAGRRAGRVYQPALSRLAAQGRVSVAGVADTGIAAAERLAAQFGAQAYASSRELLAADVAGLIVAVPPRVKDRLALEVLRAGKHLFVESPAAQSAARVRQLAGEAQSRGLVVEVAEDEAFWPAAREQQTRVAAGEIGRVIAVHNDCREFYYHAYARLHVLLGSLPRATRLSGWQAPLRPTGSAGQAPLSGAGKETWRAVTFADGLVYTQRFVHPREHGLASRPRWVVAGEGGVLLDEGREEQHAASIQHLLERWLGALSGAGAVAYGLLRAERDIALWQGLELAARLPVQPVPAGLAEKAASGLLFVRQRLAGN